MEIFQSATSSTAKKTLCCATSSHFYTFCTFPIHIAILMLINSYLNKLTMPCTHNGNKKAYAACLRCCKNKAMAGLLPQEMLFSDYELPPVGKGQTPATAGSSPACCGSSPDIFQIPPRIGSLLPYLDSQQTACCSSHGEATLLEHG